MGKISCMRYCYYFVLLILSLSIIGTSSAGSVIKLTNYQENVVFQKLNILKNSEQGTNLINLQQNPQLSFSGVSSNLLSSYVPTVFSIKYPVYSLSATHSSVNSKLLLQLNQNQDKNTMGSQVRSSQNLGLQNPDDYYTALQTYQNNLTPIQRKIDTKLLELFLDPNYPKMANEDLSGEKAAVVIPSSDLGPDGVFLGDAVHVYIDVLPGTSSSIIEPYIFGSINSGTNAFSATVPLKNIYTLASLPQVLKITIAAPPQIASLK